MRQAADHLILTHGVTTAKDVYDYLASLAYDVAWKDVFYWMDRLAYEDNWEYIYHGDIRIYRYCKEDESILGWMPHLNFN